MATWRLPPFRITLTLLILICVHGGSRLVYVRGFPDRPRPNAAQSRFAVCGLAAGRAFPKGSEGDEGEGSVDTGRIVGGREAKHNEIHYIVSLQKAGGFSSVIWSHFCGGTIYSATWIITAAHCFPSFTYDPKSDSYQIVAGEHELYLPEDGEQSLPVKRIIEHPFYNREHNDDNDIALVELVKPLTFNKNIRPVKLPSCDYIPKGKATISGWGHVNIASTEAAKGDLLGSDSLQVAEVDVFSQKQCQETISRGFVSQNKSEEFSLHENTFCAGKIERSVDSCKGDSGGPLVCHDKDGEVLCGVVSAGFGCGLKDLPGLYTYIPHFRDWIVHVTSGG